MPPTSNQLLFLKRAILSVLIIAGCFILAFIALILYGLFNSSQRETIQEVLSPDKNTVITIQIDSEDDPYYIFDLNRKTLFGRSKHLGDCQILRDGSNTEYSVLRWQDNRYLLLQVNKSRRVSKAIRIDTEHPVLPCLKPFEDPDTPQAKAKTHQLKKLMGFGGA